MKIAFLKDLFAGFLHARHFGRHFRRLVMLDSMAETGVDREVPQGLTQSLVAASTEDSAVLLQRLGTNVQGLSEGDAEAVRERVGLNEVEHEKPLTWYAHLWQCYRNPFNLLLTLLAIVSYVTEDVKATIVIGTMVVLSALLRFWQEGKSNKAADALKEMVSNTATVLRAGQRTEMPIRLLVPGDVIVVSAGSAIPGDCLILESKDLFVDEATLTGETYPVEKQPQVLPAETALCQGL